MNRIINHLAAILLWTATSTTIADTTQYTDREDWAAGVAAPITVLDFEGIPDGTPVTDPVIDPSYLSQGLQFELLGNGEPVTIDTGEGVGAVASGTMWISNIKSVGFTEGLHSIDWSFPIHTNAVGMYNVASDSHQVRLYDQADALIDQGLIPQPPNLSAFNFLGFITDTPIARVTVTGVAGNGFIGLDDIQFPTIPEPATASIVASLGFTLCARRRPQS